MIEEQDRPQDLANAGYPLPYMAALDHSYPAYALLYFLLVYSGLL